MKGTLIIHGTGCIGKKQESKQVKRAFLFGAGETGTECPRIECWDLVMALDGGLVYCVEHGIEPDLIIGDFDSLPDSKASLLEKFPEEKIIRLPREKDDTDMMAAIRVASQKGVEQFIIYGGMGGRLSHTIANLQCLAYLKKQGMCGILVGHNASAFLLQNETCIFDKKAQGYVSVFAFEKEASGVTLKNLKYEINDAKLTNAFPLGVSNEFIGKEATISVNDGTLCVILEGIAQA